MPKTLEIVNKFQAMNTNVEIVVCAPWNKKQSGEQALKRAELIFILIERALTRFDPGSELSDLNASAGKPFRASPLLFDVVEAALEAARITNGAFDPTVLPSLLSAGYDCSFEKLSTRQDKTPPRITRTSCNWQDIRLNSMLSYIYLPRGCGLDLGGIGKGWAIDQVCEILDSFPSYAVDAGGDIRVEGTQSSGAPWTIGIADPFTDSHDFKVLELREGAVCTSTTVRRRWQLDGTWQHHLIDPQTGKPSNSGIISVSVIADSAVRAETLAKAALISGPESGIRLIDSQLGAKGFLILEDGRCLCSSRFPEVKCVA